MHGGGLTVTVVSFPRPLIQQNDRTTGTTGDYKSWKGRRRNIINMTNQDRIKKRIERDKARKAEKRRALITEHGVFERVITMQNLHRSLKRRRGNVEWKGSVQRYLQHAIVKIKRTKDDLVNGKVSINQTVRRRTVYERGKARIIHAIMIDSRVIQGALCDSCITPLTQPLLIYDNPASTRGKGVSHARRRNKRFIMRSARRGRDAYALSYDFSGYFSSIPHALCRERLRDAGLDDRLLELTMYFIRHYQEHDISIISDLFEREAMRKRLLNDELVGVTLGSQISQNIALVAPNTIDHAVKERERVHEYIRFMDDGIAYGTKDEMNHLMLVIRDEAEKLGLHLNMKKTRIVKLSRGVTFLKVRYIVTETKSIVQKIVHSSIVRMRRKLKKFRKLVDRGEMELHDVLVSFKSWYGNAKRVANTYRQRKRMLMLYNQLFHGYGLKGMAI